MIDRERVVRRSSWTLTSEQDEITLDNEMTANPGIFYFLANNALMAIPGQAANTKTGSESCPYSRQKEKYNRDGL